MRQWFAPLLLAPVLGCTYTRYPVTVDDPALVRVVPVPPDSFLERFDDGSLDLHWQREVAGEHEAMVTPIVGGKGHIAPRSRPFASEGIVFPIGQVALPRYICVRPRSKGCGEAHAFEIVAPLDNVREIREVTRFDPFFSGWVVFAGLAAGTGAAGMFASNLDRDSALGGGIALTIVSAAALALGGYFFFAPPRSKTLYAR